MKHKRIQEKICKEKRKYASHKKALDDIGNNTPLRVYHCYICNGYHTTSKQGVKP